MRKVIIDTDVGSDDAVAILMALLDDSVDVLAITTVSGNVPVEQATANCLQTIEVAGKDVPVYAGADRPLVRQPVHAMNVHGKDGMGDMNLIHPTTAPVPGIHACDAILDLVRKNPWEIELITLGPVTNIALAIMKEPETMGLLKSIWSMSTAGFGPGNTTPVAEFNVYADAEAYKVMMNCGVPIYIGGADLYEGDAAWTQEDMDALLDTGNPVAKFAVECNAALAEYNLLHCQKPIVTLPDAVTMAGFLWEDVRRLVPCMAYVCVSEPATYGQVIFYAGQVLADMSGFDAKPYGFAEPNCSVIADFDGKLYKQRLAELLVRHQ